MFGAIGTFVYRMRFAVIAVLIALMGCLGLYGLDLNKHLSQSGWFDPTSSSDAGAKIADKSLGRDHKSDIILLITPPEGTKVDDVEFGAKVENFVDALIKAHPDIVNRDDPGVVDPFYLANQNAASKAAQDTIRARTFNQDKTHAFISIGVTGNDDTAILQNYKTIEPFFEDISGRFDLPGTTFELAGLQPVAGSMADGMDKDIRRAEVIALPVVALMLFFVFGGAVAAFLPVLIGGLTIAGSLGLMKVLAQVTELNVFAQSVVTLIGLGIAIDYGLFIVSRFREELAEGYSTKAAVRRTVMTAGQTVVFSATIIVAALACLLIMPQGFLKSVSYGAIASVSLAALLSITVLPAALGILGPRVDALGFKFLRRTKTREEIENGFWGRLAGWVMKHPVATAVPTVLILLVLTIPFGSIKFGGISEAYLPPDNANRIAQENFDTYFPTERTEEIKLVIAYDANSSDDGAKLDAIATEANKIPGFTKQFSTSSDAGALSGTYGDDGPAILQMSAGLKDRTTAAEAIKELRAIDTQGLRMWVTGTPTLTQDSIDALMERLPLMAIMLVLITGLLMFLAFGSVVLPIKAALMTALGLGATLGILTWIFVDGHGAGIANFTPGPLFAAVLVLIIAIIFGLSTDYEIFLLSRMVEARQKGASTTEAIRLGTAYTGRIITAAAAILVVVTGAFGLSEIVMMKYIAYGMIAALILDATIIRMLLVPSVMKLLGDDCWWAPRWMQTLQRKIGLGETILDDEPDQMRDAARAARVRSAGSLVSEAPTSVMRSARAAVAGAAAGPTAGSVRRPSTPSAPIPAAPAPVTPVGGARRGPSAPPSGPTRTPAPGTTRSATTPVTPPTPGVPAPQPSRVPPALPRRSRLRRDPSESRPDTGSWSLGSGGITSGSFPAQPQARTTATPAARPAPARAPQTPRTPAPAPQPPQQPRQSRPAAPTPGGARQAPVASPAPQAPQAQTPQTPTPQTPAPRPQAPQPQSAQPRPGQSRPGQPADPRDSVLARRPALDQTGKRPLAASLAPENAEPTAPATPDEPASGKRSRPEDGKRSRTENSDGTSRQISVQDLLRRSKSD